MTGYRRVIGMQSQSQSPRRLRRMWDDLRRKLEHLEGDARRVAWVRVRAIERILAGASERLPVRPRLNFRLLRMIVQRAPKGGSKRFATSLTRAAPTSPIPSGL